MAKSVRIIAGEIIHDDGEHPITWEIEHDCYVTLELPDGRVFGQIDPDDLLAMAEIIKRMQWGTWTIHEN
jgi:hypothetical protein